ncbi:MATE family efflux transporter [Streptomyces sp. DSM 44915]|uniref:MATE family efflux transporter n=1 Tax=Streptomyces chisholmiae TaxID=3075540 RepID=A0ABU2JWW2_9ACTN|nr:MATE family efflux transporter [Streptomyces sp. DSM 44915]MDT0269447.1 MATE family efflux transporter [Streptomyces sp. DSM 44915]
MPDLTRGPALAGIVGIAAPLALANLLQQGYLVVDSAVVGHYVGVTGLAAMGAAQPLYTIVSSLFTGVSGAFAVRLGQLAGAGRRDDPSALLALALCTGVWSVLTAGVALLATDPLLALAGVTGEVAAAARAFLLTLCSGLVAVYALGAVCTVLTGRGDARAATRLMIVASLLNGAFAWLFVGVWRFGVVGAALAVLLANALAAAVGLAGLVREYRRRPAGTAPVTAEAVRAELRGGLRIGGPMAAQYLLIGLGVLALVWIVTPFGEPALAALTVIARLELLTSVLFLTLSGALMVFTAQNTGAGRPARVREGLRRTVWLGVTLSVVVSGLLLAQRGPIAALFSGSAETRLIIERYLLVTAPFFGCYTLMVVLHGWFNGQGRAVVPLVCTLLSLGVVRLPLSYGLGRAWGVDGVLWATVIGWAVGLGYTLLAARRPGRRAGPAPPEPARTEPVRPERSPDDEWCAAPMPNPELITFDNGLQCFAQSPDEARFQYREIFELGCYDKVRLSAGSFVVDVGANIGLFSLFVKQRFPDAEILAFEPIPETLRVLRRNVSLHGLTDVTVHGCALGAAHEPDVAFTYYPVIPGNSTRYPAEKELQKTVLTPIEGAAVVAEKHAGVEVRASVARLSDFLADRPRVDLLEVDVEGAELEVLRGIDAGDWPKIDQVVLEVQDIDGRLAAIRALLHRHGLESTVEISPLIPPEIRTYVVHATRP